MSIEVLKTPDCLDTVYEMMQWRRRDKYPLSNAQKLSVFLYKFLIHKTIESPEMEGIRELCKEEGILNKELPLDFLSTFVLPGILSALRAIESKRSIEEDKKGVLIFTLSEMCFEFSCSYSEAQQNKALECI